MLRVAGVAVSAALAAILVRRGGGEFGFLMILVVFCVLFGLCAGYLSTVLDYLEELRETAGVSSAVLTPLLKTVGIGLVTRLAAGICADAGENALASFVELCGTILAIFSCLPLLSAVLELMRQLMRGAF